MELKIRKQDLVWGYLAHIFSITSGIIVLPVILRLLTPQEIGLNYILLTIGGFVTLFDFGFAPQFGRNITYIFGGSQKLLKEGVDISKGRQQVNYKLLFVLIKSAKFLYNRLSLLVLFLMLTGGTFYIYFITDSFTSVENTLVIWLLFSVSVFFNMYYAYYSSLLNGKGMITEHRKTLVYSKLFFTVVAISMLLMGFGLLSVAVAYFVSPFVLRFFSHKFFFTGALKSHFIGLVATKKEIKELISIIWFNARKLGLVYLGSFTITKIGIFIAGLFLTLESIASYGLMVQLVGIIAVIAATVNTLYQPRLSFLRAQNNKKQLLADFAYTLTLFIFLYFLGSVLFVAMGDWVLNFIGSATMLPAKNIIILYCIVVFLEINHSMFASFLVTNNEIPMVKATLISGFFITIFTYIVLKYTDLGILGIVIAPAIVQASYNNWKWPLEVVRFFDKSYLKIILLGGRIVFKQVRMLL